MLAPPRQVGIGEDNMIIKRIGVISAAKIGGIIGAAFGLIIGVIFFLVYSVIGVAASSFGPDHGSGAGALLGGLGVISIIAFPVMYGIAGFIGGLLQAFIYNLAAGFVGGLQVETE